MSPKPDDTSSVETNSVERHSVETHGGEADDTLSLDEAAVPTQTGPTPAAPATASNPTLLRTTFPVPPSVPSVPSRRPPVRWSGIVWGVLLVVFAAVTLVVVSSPARLAGMTVWIASLTPGAAWALWIAVLGLVIVVSALLGAIGATQRSRRRRSF